MAGTVLLPHTSGWATGTSGYSYVRELYLRKFANTSFERLANLFRDETYGNIANLDNLKAEELLALTQPLLEELERLYKINDIGMCPCILELLSELIQNAYVSIKKSKDGKACAKEGQL
jgi:hypothetical protein